MTWRFAVVSEHLVRRKLAEEVEVEEQEVNTGINASSGGDRPPVVILNGLHLEDERYVCLFLNVWIDIDRMHRRRLSKDFKARPASNLQADSEGG
jgi:hypothetical protein